MLPAGETGGLGTIAEFEEEESDTENNSQSGGERNEAKAAANTEEEQSDFEEDEASESEFRYSGAPKPWNLSQENAGSGH